MMNYSLMEISCCPTDNADLQLYTIEGDYINIELGILVCPKCQNAWSIIDGIPRFYSESSLDILKDVRFFLRYYKVLDSYEKGLAKRVLAKINRLLDNPFIKDIWEFDEMNFWENHYASKLETIKQERINFNRFLPRKKNLLEPLKKHKINTVLEIGCGACETIHHFPEFLIDKRFIGTDLSFNALNCAKKIIKGDFVMCDVSALPFKPKSIDYILSFGVLHHLKQKENALTTLFSKLGSEGFLGFSEKLRSHKKVRTSKIIRYFKTKLLSKRRNHARSEYIDRENALDICRRNGEIINIAYEYSIVRYVLIKVLVDILGMNTEKLIKLIIKIDHISIENLSRRFYLFRETAMHVLIKKEIVN